jgi:uncharacterized membrane protein YdjX (TVP38/TMEM64 family)
MMLSQPAAAENRAPRMHHAAVYRRAAILLTLCVVLAGIASSSALHEALLDVLAATRDIIARHAVAGALTFIVLAAVSAMFTFVSIAVIVPAAVFAWGAPASVGLLWLGWILGGVTTYSIGRFLGRPAVRWLTASETLRRLESRIPADAPVWLVMLLQLALPSEIPGYVLGLVRYSFASYVLALGLAELPYTIATVYLGASFVAGQSGLILTTGAFVAAFSLVTFYMLRRVLNKRAARSSAPPASMLRDDRSLTWPHQ